MVASAERIDFISHEAININDAGGSRSRLTVNFQVFKRGPAHVAGLLYSSNFWAQRNEVQAKFIRFEGDSEVWQASTTVPGNSVNFEYVIFCDDHRDIQNVRKLYNTNFGETFRIQSTF
jgi:hypothetical protein